MFVCTTELICDFCGKYYSSTGNKMADCISKQRFRDCQHKKGWKTIYSKYDVCPDCVRHYGMKYIRKASKERESD